MDAAALFEKYTPLAMAVARPYRNARRDLAADIAQEALQALWERAEAYDAAVTDDGGTPISFPHFARRRIHGAIVDYLRKEERQGGQAPPGARDSIPQRWGGPLCPRSPDNDVHSIEEAGMGDRRPARSRAPYLAAHSEPIGRKVEFVPDHREEDPSARGLSNARFDELLGRVPGEDRAILRSLYVDGMTAERAAIANGVNERRVRYAIERARAYLIGARGGDAGGRGSRDAA